MLTQLESSMRALLGGEGPNPGTALTTVGTEENPLSRLVRAFQNAAEGRSATEFHPPDALARVSTRLPIRGSRASEIYAEWTYEGRRTVDECVRLSRWRDAKLKTQAQHVARAVDALKDSGLDPATEPAGEVLLRQLVALFFPGSGRGPRCGGHATSPLGDEVGPAGCSPQGSGDTLQDPGVPHLSGGEGPARQPCGVAGDCGSQTQGQGQVERQAQGQSYPSTGRGGRSALFPTWASFFRARGGSSTTYHPGQSGHNQIPWGLVSPAQVFKEVLRCPGLV